MNSTITTTHTFIALHPLHWINDTELFAYTLRNMNDLQTFMKSQLFQTTKKLDYTGIRQQHVITMHCRLSTYDIKRHVPFNCLIACGLFNILKMTRLRFAHLPSLRFVRRASLAIRYDCQYDYTNEVHRTKRSEERCAKRIRFCCYLQVEYCTLEHAKYFNKFNVIIAKSDFTNS